VRRQIGIVRGRIAASHQRERKRQRDDRFRDRNKAIVLMRDGGMTLGEIASEVGLSREQVRVVLVRAWRDAQPLESWQPRARIYRFAPSARAGHVIYDALRETYSDIPADVCPKMAAAALARYTRRDLTGDNIGRKTIAVLERWLAGFGLTFADEAEPIWWS
jgi:hypothetical protein